MTSERQVSIPAPSGTVPAVAPDELAAATSSREPVSRASCRQLLGCSGARENKCASRSKSVCVIPGERGGERRDFVGVIVFAVAAIRHPHSNFYNKATVCANNITDEPAGALVKR